MVAIAWFSVLSEALIVAKLKLRKLKSAWIVPKLLLGSQSCTNYNITLKPTESPPPPFSFDMVVHCLSQLSMVQWLSSSIFPCLSFVVPLW